MSVILTKEEMDFIKIRNQVISNKEIELALIKREKEIMMKGIFSKYALDENKKYQIDDRGVVSEFDRPDGVNITDQSEQSDVPDNSSEPENAEPIESITAETELVAESISPES